MKRTATLIFGAALTIACSPSPAAPEPKTDEEKAIYAMGIALSREVASLHLTKAEVQLLAAGLTDGALGRPHKAEPADYAERLGKLADTRSAAAAWDQKTVGAEFLTKAAAAPGARKLPTGLVFTSLVDGTGNSPMLSQSVRVRYRGTLPDGTVVDSTESEKEPATVAMGRVIPCWAQALQLMKEGGKARIGCPSDLAYGDRGMPPKIPPGAALQFEVELVAVINN